MPARHTHGGGFLPVPTGTTPSWQSLRLGAGGHLTGMSVGYDGTNTTVIRTDNGGAYLWNPSATSPAANNGVTGAWQQLINPQSFGLSTTTTSNPFYILGAAGVGEIQVYPGTSPGDSNILYQVYIAIPTASPSVPANTLITIWKSTNKGGTWTQCPGFTPISIHGMFSNDAWRLYNPKMAIHPTNSNIVYVGFENGQFVFSDGNNYGLWVTLDGGTTLNRMDPGVIPSPTDFGYSGMSFNPADGTKMYINISGVGIYYSSNADLGIGSTWTAVAAGYAGNRVSYGMTGANNKYFVCDDGVYGNLWVYTGGLAGTWAHKITGIGPGQGAASIARDSSNVNYYVVSSSTGSLIESVDGGVTWGASSG